MKPAQQFEGYTWYFSTVYGTWVCLSPVSGFHSFHAEDSVYRLLSQELRKPIQKESLAAKLQEKTA